MSNTCIYYNDILVLFDRCKSKEPLLVFEWLTFFAAFTMSSFICFLLKTPWNQSVGYLFLFTVCAIILATLDAILYEVYFSTLRKLLLIPTGLDQFTPYVQKECESAHTCTTDHTSIHHRISPDGACLVAKTSISKRNVAEGCAVVRLVVRGGAWVVFSLVGQ